MCWHSSFKVGYLENLYFRLRYIECRSVVPGGQEIRDLCGTPALQELTSEGLIRSEGLNCGFDLKD